VEHPLTTSLSITAIGMTLLFLALVLFYGLMSLMMSVLNRAQAGQGAADPHAGPKHNAAALRAAAVAVALARAEAEAEQERASWSSPTKVDMTAASAPSAWWTLHHHRQISSPSQLRRAR
jgi:Na+-transporting methylmalonyl-CoA/oxaloacetate decarboxylase gamma subunit